MEQQRYRGTRLRENDALMNPHDVSQDDARDESWPAPIPEQPDEASVDPARARVVSDSNHQGVSASSEAGQPVLPPPDESVPDDQITLLAERQPGASAVGMPAPQLNGAQRGAPGSNSETLHDTPRQWIAPQVVSPARSPRLPEPPQGPRHHSHVRWQAAESWGPVTFTIEATTAAGASYLFWWVSGLLIYFNERHNRFVRFHAMQSILLTGALTVVGVIGFIVSSLCDDLATATGRHAYSTLGSGIGLITIAVIVFPWLFAMIAAWSGNYLRLPIVGQYAERYAASPIEPTPPPLY